MELLIQPMESNSREIYLEGSSRMYYEIGYSITGHRLPRASRPPESTAFWPLRYMYVSYSEYKPHAEQMHGFPTRPVG